MKSLLVAGTLLVAAGLVSAYCMRTQPDHSLTETITVSSWKFEEDGLPGGIRVSAEAWLVSAGLESESAGLLFFDVLATSENGRVLSHLTGPLDVALDSDELLTTEPFTVMSSASAAGTELLEVFYTPIPGKAWSQCQADDSVQISLVVH